MKSKVFLKFIISYVVVLVIPIILVSILIYSRFVGVLTREVISSTSGMLTQVSDVMDGHIESLNNVSALINDNEKLTPLVYARDINNVDLFPNVQTAVKELSKYRNANSIIYNIFIFFRDSDVIVSDTSKYSHQSFLNRFYVWENTDDEEFRRQISTLANTVVTSSQPIYTDNKTMNVITYMRPLPANFPSPKATLVITIKKTAIDQLVAKVLGQYNGTVYMADAHNNIISSTNLGPESMDLYEATSLIRGIDELKRLDYSIMNRNSIISYIKSPATGWKYMAVMDPKQILNKVDNIKTASVIIIVASLFIGLLLAYLFSRGNYSRVKSITDSLQAYRRSMDSGFRNEWDFINNAITSYVIENTSLHHKLEEQMPVVKNSFLMRLLKENHASGEEVASMSSLLGLNIQSGPYAVMLLNIDACDRQGMSRLQSIQEVMRMSIFSAAESSCAPVGCGYAVDMDVDSIAVLVVLSNAEGMECQLKQAANNIRQFVKENFGFTITVGMSSIYKKLEHVSEAYREALTALDYKIIKGENTVITYSEINNRINNTVYYSFEQEKQILACLKVGDFETIRSILDNIVSSIKSEPVSLESVKCIYFEIVNTAVKSLNEIENGNIKVDYHLPSLVYTRTIDEVYKEVTGFYLKVCEQIQSTRYSRNVDLIERVLAYLDSSFSNKMLSVELIAGEFGVSPSYLSRIFKDQVGTCFTDYLHELRLRKAKEQLAGTERNIADIADAVGYNSVHNFIRVFKRYECITPTEFRLSEKGKPGVAL